MSKFTAFANDVLDAVYDTGASGTLALGPVSARVNYTLPMKVALTTTLCTASAAGTEVAGGSYARQSIAGSMAAASAGSKSSNAAITFSNMPACTWNDVFVADSTGTPKNMTFRGGTNLAKTVNAGDTAMIPSGSLTGTEA
ncbi:hypothetical protein EFK50_00980 [Nocardioides marmoriginsengisoli]|uniref:Uncharacterized protein n=1 Tax=Nocardioides marmoriginsengisoli TaxID=661483 RepID=A0A3N0CS54_9ACTN|nr:hypothetical protein [Nocardioides marmoriginsengisoli]RNL66230.1 hypothetical protein EFK50_00980 [Nocardioides marmoriginsengisoli]